MSRRACFIVIALVSIAAGPPPVVEVRNAGDPANRIEARAQLDAAAIRLSGEVKLTLTVEGPAPLRVTVPRPFLTRANVWRVRDYGLPLREVLSGSRERWSQAYHLSPLVPGEPKVALGPLVVQAGGMPDLTIPWDEDRLPIVKVVTAIETPSPEALRPATDVEPLPPEPIIEHRGIGWRFAVIPALLILSALGILFGRRKKRPTAPRDAAWALRELAAADLTADRTAAVLRQYLAFRFGFPAEFRTTPELTAALRTEDRIPGNAANDWHSLLEECDAARFSGTAAAVAGLADRARALVEDAEKTRQLTTETQRHREDKTQV
jgi:hypothetical protein